MMTILFFFFLSVVLLLLEIVRETHTFRITDYKISSEKLTGLHQEKKVILLSDLHNRVYGKKNDTLLAAIRRANPDLILIAGDMLVGKKGESWEVAYDLVKQLPKICPVYYGYGNHEQRVLEHPGKYATHSVRDVSHFQEYKVRLQRHGVRFLENESTELVFDQCRIRISGLALPNSYYRKAKNRTLKPQEIIRFLGPSDSSCFQILIAHNPAFFEAYRTWGADLSVSGHLHGGIVRLPGIGGIISPQTFLFPRYSGELTREGDSYIAVSKGLGSHTINVRLLNEPEIVILHLMTCENQKSSL
ncbi:MAG: metallophosphoesterase [Hespellia sp.]|nr:metallophosphoesterase [Hespellia sp.]